jgi:protein-S-isoprenylcysteine O-methyltransferase
VFRLIVAALLAFVAFGVAPAPVQHVALQRILSQDFRELFVPPALIGWIAAILSVAGIAFAIWARFHLGRNWSGVPTKKENHELVTSGPYRWVRHPIYSGVLLAAFGSALTGTIFGIGVFLVASIIFFFRIDKEEKIMLELFPNEYPAYQAMTKRLIPFVW